MVKALQSGDGDLDTVPDCQRCGACCFSSLATYVRVSGTDYERLGARAEALTDFHGNRCYMRMSLGHCAALVLDPPTGRFFCSAYRDRPEVCRTLARGSSSCQAERLRKAAHAKRALAIVHERE